MRCLRRVISLGRFESPAEMFDAHECECDNSGCLMNESSSTVTGEKIMQQRSIFSGAILMTMAGLLTVGCASSEERYDQPPRESHRGRLDDPYQSTRADQASDRASIPALLEFSDLTAQRLAQDITSLPHVIERYDAASKVQKRLVLEMGGIDNKTRTPSTDFELIQRRLRSELMKSQLIRSKFMFVESVARQEQELQRIQQGGGASQTNRYANEDIYILQGDFMEAIRDSRRQYFFNFKLVHAQTREIVFDSSYDLGQVTVR